MKITKSVRAARDVRASYEVVLKDGDMYTKEDGNNDIAYSRRPVIKSVSSIDEASKLVREFIDDLALGASEFTGGIVLQDAVPVYVISYNGKATPFQEYIDRWGTGIIENSRVLKGLDYTSDQFVQGCDNVTSSEDFIVDYPLDNRSDEWWANEEKKRLARELADEEDAYDLENEEGIYSSKKVRLADVTSTSTRARIADLETRIAKLEERIHYLNKTGADVDEIIDYQLELDELRDELNFAWQDDEAEWNYALEQQEFNPDGSLKGYSDYDVDASTDVTAASKLLNNKKIQVGLQWNRDWHCMEVKSISPDHKTCKITEDWISEDSGKEMHKEFTFNISEDPQYGEFVWEDKYKEYAFDDEEEDGYKWWARMYATGADNYPYDAPEGDEVSEEEESDEGYWPTHFILWNKYNDQTVGKFDTEEEARVYREASEMDPNEWHVVETDYDPY